MTYSTKRAGKINNRTHMMIKWGKDIQGKNIYLMSFEYWKRIFCGY